MWEQPSRLLPFFSTPLLSDEPMNKMHWLNSSWRKSPEATSRQLVNDLVRRLDGHVVDCGNGLVAVAAPKEYSYQVSLYLSSHDWWVDLSAAADLTFDRDLCLRETAMLLLEENCTMGFCSYRLVPCDSNRTVVLATTIDARKLKVDELVPTAKEMIERMQAMIRKLYGMGLILPHPHAKGQVNYQG